MPSRLRASIAVALVASSTLLATPDAQAATCDRAATAVAQTAGPYYKGGAPSRSNLRETGTFGTPLLLTGRVLDANCRPIVGAKVDFWQADGRGAYDNTGYRLRGTQQTSATGAYRLATVLPGLYPGRTEHIHVKITPPGSATFTTQLYFPGSTHNAEDGIFSPVMLVRVTQTSPSLMRATFTFVLPK